MLILLLSSSRLLLSWDVSVSLKQRNLYFGLGILSKKAIRTFPPFYLTGFCHRGLIHETLLFFDGYSQKMTSDRESGGTKSLWLGEVEFSRNVLIFLEIQRVYLFFYHTATLWKEKFLAEYYDCYHLSVLPNLVIPTTTKIGSCWRLLV